MAQCSEHYKVLEKQTFFGIVGLLMTLAAIAFGFGFVSFASADNLRAVQKQADNQREEMRDLRAEMNQRFDRLDAKLDKLARGR